MLPKLRKLTILFLCLALCWTSFACGNSASVSSPVTNGKVTAATSLKSSPLKSGQYPVQQASYDDATGEYSLMLLNTPAGTPPFFRTPDLQMAQLTPEEIQAGKTSYLNLDGNQAVLHLTPDFKIEYVHNVTEAQPNPQTGQPQTVIVRQESSFWTPFAASLAANTVANMLFTPHYYVPPLYQPGVGMTGYGGYGRSYTQAVEQYQSRYQAPPPVVQNRQAFRTTGNARSASPQTANRKPQPDANRSTGSGYGSNTLRSSNQSRPTNKRTGFGSGNRSRSSGGSRKR